MSIQNLVFQWELDAMIPNRDTPYPHLPPEDEAQRRMSFIEEELEELLEAERAGDLVEIADALGDLVWVIYGAAHAYGIDLDQVLDEIGRSNYTKLEGGSTLDTNGKLVKGPAYETPDIEKILLHQGM